MEESSFLRHYILEVPPTDGRSGLLALVIVDVLRNSPADFSETVRRRRRRRRTASARFSASRSITWRRVRSSGLPLRLADVSDSRGVCSAGRDLRSRFAHHLFGLSMSFFDRRRIGDMMSLSTSDVEVGPADAWARGFSSSSTRSFIFSVVPDRDVHALAEAHASGVRSASDHSASGDAKRARDSQPLRKRAGAVQPTLRDGAGSLNGIRVTKAFAKEDVQNPPHPRGGRGIRSPKPASRASADVLRSDARFHDESGAGACCFTSAAERW